MHTKHMIERMIDVAEVIAREQLKGGEELLSCAKIDPSEGVIFNTRRWPDPFVRQMTISFDKIDKEIIQRAVG